MENILIEIIVDAVGLFLIWLGIDFDRENEPEIFSKSWFIVLLFLSIGMFLINIDLK